MSSSCALTFFLIYVTSHSSSPWSGSRGPMSSLDFDPFFRTIIILRYIGICFAHCLDPFFESLSYVHAKDRMFSSSSMCEH